MATRYLVSRPRNSKGAVPILFFSLKCKSFYDQADPVVITDVVTRWDAFSKWSVEYFLTLFPQRHLKVALLPEGLSQPGTEDIACNFTEFVQQLRENETAAVKVYCQQRKVAKYFPELMSDYEYPMLIDAQLRRTNTLFIGSAGTRSSIHYDRPYIDNLVWTHCIVVIVAVLSNSRSQAILAHRSVDGSLSHSLH